MANAGINLNEYYATNDFMETEQQVEYLQSQLLALGHLK